MAALQISFCKARIAHIVDEYALRCAQRKQRIVDMTSMVLAIFSPLSFIVGPL